MSEDTSQWALRGDMENHDEDDSSTTTNTNTNNNTNQQDLGNIFAGIGALLGGGAQLTDSISNAAQGGGTTQTTINPNNNTNNNNPPPPKGVSPWVIGGGVALVMVIIGILIYASNGSKNTGSKAK